MHCYNAKIGAKLILLLDFSPRKPWPHPISSICITGFCPGRQHHPRRRTPGVAIQTISASSLLERQPGKALFNSQGAAWS